MLVMAAMLFAGCANPGRFIARPPTSSDPARAATIIVVQPYTFAGSGTRITITLDDAAFCELGVDEHVAIQVPTGEHFIGMKARTRESSR